MHTCTHYVHITHTDTDTHTHTHSACVLCVHKLTYFKHAHNFGMCACVCVCMCACVCVCVLHKIALKIILPVTEQIFKGRRVLTFAREYSLDYLDCMVTARTINLTQLYSYTQSP